MSKHILLIEPFYGGSHKVLIDLVQDVAAEAYLAEEVVTVTMRAKKWHWRARTCALHLAELIPRDVQFKVLFASSVLNLAELLSLRPDLMKTRKIVYFHENQLVYPVRQYKERDFQYGYNQVLTCLVADLVLFNSSFNRSSFLEGLKKFFSILPDYRPTNLKEKIEGKSQVLYFPISVPLLVPAETADELHIVWPHRWEHDKNPDAFLRALYCLKDSGLRFQVSILGEGPTRVGSELQLARQALGGSVVHWGHASPEEYRRTLASAHVAVSTALHEFFGVAMLEATMSGCFPLCPNKLVYPEIYPPECLYKDFADLLGRLKEFAACPRSALDRRRNLEMDFHKFQEITLKQKYLDLLKC